MSRVDEKKVSFVVSEEPPIPPKCICCSARKVAFIGAYGVVPLITCLMTYFVSVSQEFDLTTTENDILIASTCILSILIVGFAVAFIYGMAYQRRYFLIPYIVESLLACLATLVVLIGGIVWGNSRGLWQSKPVVMSLVTAALAILSLCEPYLLVSYIRCYRYFKTLEQYKAKVNAAA